MRCIILGRAGLLSRVLLWVAQSISFMEAFVKSRIAPSICFAVLMLFPYAALAQTSCEKLVRCHVDECHRHVGHLRRGRKLQTARRAGPARPQRSFARILPRGRRRQADERFRHPLRGLAAPLRLERQIRAGRQRRICGHNSVQRDGSLTAERLCHSRNRRWARRRARRKVGNRASGKSEGLRLSCRP